MRITVTRFRRCWYTLWLLGRVETIVVSKPDCSYVEASRIAEEFRRLRCVVTVEPMATP